MPGVNRPVPGKAREGSARNCDRGQFPVGTSLLIGRAFAVRFAVASQRGHQIEIISERLMPAGFEHALPAPSVAVDHAAISSGEGRKTFGGIDAPENLHDTDVGRLRRRELGIPSAILANASCIILCHNHPSGFLEPSPEDIAFTKHVILCGRMIGIKVHDHLVVSSRGYCSMNEHGLIRI